MIIIGSVLVAIGVGEILELERAFTLLIGLGGGMILSGVSGKLGWPSHGWISRRGRASPDSLRTVDEEPA